MVVVVVDCPFCLENWSGLTVVETAGDVAFVVPLNPVTPGHVLAIHKNHTCDAADEPWVARELMFAASAYVGRHDIQANLITSIGAAATQTVFHTHLHVVPRLLDDGLMLPWS